MFAQAMNVSGIHQNEVRNNLSICPCCGASLEGDINAGCESCGAKPVGPPLCQPERQLPGYGYALFVGVSGALLALVLTISSLSAFIEGGDFSLRFWNFAAAIETAAWRLKWSLLPAAFGALWLGSRIYTRIRLEPARFAGQRLARGGLVASAMVIATTALAIGITIPARLEQRRISREAGQEALLYASHRAFLDYRALYGTYPATLADLRRLPDPDGVITNALARLDPDGYRPTSIQASRSPEKSPMGRGRARLRAVSITPEVDDTSERDISFTSYELVWHGPDGIMGTADDRRIRDGVVAAPSSSDASQDNSSAAPEPRTP